MYLKISKEVMYIYFTENKLRKPEHTVKVWNLALQD